MSVLYESNEGIALITIDRADKRNAINPAVAQGLTDAWVRFAESDDLVAILTGAGNDAFCVGADLKDLPGEVWQALPNFAVPCDKPIIAAVSGYVIGAGASMALYSDIVIASESASSSIPRRRWACSRASWAAFPRRCLSASGSNGRRPASP